MKHLLILLISLFFISCSEKKTNIDGKNGKFNQADRNADNRISVEEFILYQKEEQKSSVKSSTLALINKCDKNHNNKIDFDEVEDLKDLVAPSKVYYKEGNCPIRKDNFSHFDLNNNKIITQEEILSKYNEVKPRYTSHLIKDKERKYDLTYAQKKVNRCDKNGDKYIDIKETNATTCKIPTNIFRLIDADKNNLVNTLEILTLPEKYATYRHPVMDKDYWDENEVTTSTELSKINLYRCDKNNDHILTEKEATSRNCGYSHNEFIKNDVNKDGMFSDKDREYYSMQEYLKRFDLDKDGYLNEVEFMRRESQRNDLR